MVLLLATAALGLVAYNNMNPKPVVQVTENTPAPAPRTVGYLVAARPLPAGTEARDEDFRPEPLDSVPPGAFRATPEDRIRLRGSLVLKDLSKGSPVTSQDVVLRGDLARALKPGSRAISIKFDQESGVSRLIRPGDYVDVVLTQVIDKADLDKADLVHRAYRTLSEIVLHKVLVVAIDQEIVQGGPANNAPANNAPANNAPANNATAGKAQTVSLQLAPEQVKKITVAEQLGKLSLAIRSAGDQQDTGDTGTMLSTDVSPEMARQSATVKVYRGDKVTEYPVKRQDARSAGTMRSTDVSPEIIRQSATVVVKAGDQAKEYSVELPEKQ
jgi:pilus assembly protein CpaB